MNYPVPVMGNKSKVNQAFVRIDRFSKWSEEIWDAQQNTYELLFHGLVSINLLT